MRPLSSRLKIGRKVKESADARRSVEENLLLAHAGLNAAQDEISNLRNQLDARRELLKLREASTAGGAQEIRLLGEPVEPYELPENEGATRTVDWWKGYEAAQLRATENRATQLQRGAQAVADALHQQATGATLIAWERQRQLADKGWSPSHDDEHTEAELAAAAECYLEAYQGIVYPTGRPSSVWPFEAEAWKPSEKNIDNLIRAGALIAAEIDRLRRLDT